MFWVCYSRSSRFESKIRLKQSSFSFPPNNFVLFSIQLTNDIFQIRLIRHSTQSQRVLQSQWFIDINNK